MRWLLRPRPVIVVILLAAMAGTLPALGYVSIETGQMVLINPLAEGGLSPILSTAGAALPIIEVGIFRFELSTLFWGTQYYLGPVSGRPLPAQYEAGQFTVLGIWVAPLAGVHFPLADGKLELGLAGTLALNFRIPLFPWDAVDLPTWPETARTTATYFFAGRFLFPETDVWIRWHVAESLSLALTLKALFPLFQLWDDGGIADQMILAAVVGFDIRIPPRLEAGTGGPP